jgi:hypothetical protein
MHDSVKFVPLDSRVIIIEAEMRKKVVIEYRASAVAAWVPHNSTDPCGGVVTPGQYRLEGLPLARRQSGPGKELYRPVPVLPLNGSLPKNVQDFVTDRFDGVSFRIYADVGRTDVSRSACLQQRMHFFLQVERGGRCP